MNENDKNISTWGYRLDDHIKKRRVELEKRSQSERENPFQGDSVPDKQDRIDQVFGEDVLKAFFFFAKTYYPEYTTSEFADFHREIMSYANTRNGEFHLIAAPPEHGKSILFGIWKVFIGIRGLRHKHAQICEDKRLAENNIGWVKTEFEMNWRIIHDFGNLVHKNHNYKEVFVVRNYDYDGTQKESDNPYTGYAWFGHQGTLKGFMFYQYRIDSVEFDDYEPIAKSKNKELVEEREKWIFSEVEGRTSRDSVMIWIHNNSRKGSCADNLHNTNREKVISHKYPAHDGKWNPLWPQHWSVDELKQKKLKIGSIVWYGEWMQEPVIQGKIFKAEWIKRYRNMPEDLVVLGRIDFSSGSSKTASYKAIVMLGYSMKTRRFYVVPGCWVRQDTINRLIDACYQSHEDWADNGLLNIKIESDMRQDVIYSPYFTLKEQEKGYRVPIGEFEVRGLGDKDSRVSRMESPMQLGLILWPEDLENDPDIQELLNHVLAWDYGSANKRLDGADALASAYIDLDKIARSWASDSDKEYKSVDSGQPRHI